MHPNYMAPKPGTCPICNMDLVPVKSGDGSGAISSGSDSTSGFVRIDPAVVQNMGVRTQRAEIRALRRDIRASAVVAPDERRTFVVTARVMGYIEKLYANYTGLRIEKGDALLELYSPDLVSGQTEYLSAFASRNLAGSESLLSSARQRLLNWDISAGQIEQLEKRGAVQKTMTIVAPAGGNIVEKMVTEGQSVEPGMTLFKIIDYSHVWVNASIYQQDIPIVRLNQKAEVLLDYYPGKKYEGRIVYIAPELDQSTKTLQVRVDLANTPDFAVKPGMNATIVIGSALSVEAVSIPDQAVIHSGLRTLAIVSRGNGLFEPREIVAGQSAEGYTHIIKGLNAGEEIVISSQFLIDAESNMKAAVMSMTAAQEQTVQAGASGGSIQSSSASNNAKTVQYTCPMDAEIVSDHPGKCPKCKMNLVKKE